MRTMGRQMRRRQLRGASLWVLRENIGACRFYEAIGGEIVGEREDIREDRVLVEAAYGWRSLVRLAEVIT
jgi:ribosomal protein S18 acetylase RimI-like enzyme